MSNIYSNYNLQADVEELPQPSPVFNNVQATENEVYAMYPVNKTGVAQTTSATDLPWFKSYQPLKVVYWQSLAKPTLHKKIYKRAFDISFSLVVMSFGLPVFALIYLITKFSSPGPVFYQQERIGRANKRFKIYKFRSMHVNAEKLGPQLSSSNDPRITKWGRVIRRTRLDELPQFWNVLKGDMSVVGPRPERQYYIDQIVNRRPDYLKLQSLKPGITSIGQVQYGYAEDVEQMCERVAYDMKYIESMNLRTDLLIICKTVKIMCQGRGK